jgi:integrase
MKSRKSSPKASQPKGDWQKTQYSNLIRYVPSGTYFARVRVRGKLIRQSLKTDVLSVAKLRLADLEKSEREAAESKDATTKGRMTFGDCVDLFKTQTNASTLLKPTAKLYRMEAVAAIYRTWPGIKTSDVRRISANECKTWAAKLSNEYSSSRYNGTLGVMRAIFNVAIETGALYRNPAVDLHRARVKLKALKLPDSKKFEEFVAEIENAKGRDSKKCANLVRFLSFGGFRRNEAANITWADCDFKKGEIIVRGDAETGTKNWSVRRLPMIPEMRLLLEKLRAERPNEPTDTRVMQVRECIQAMTRAAKNVGIARITHHDLRHLFATRCIESGVDIPTVSRWLGHKDGGALAMKTYGHLRDQHSAAKARQRPAAHHQPQRPQTMEVRHVNSEKQTPRRPSAA